ncbi:TPA: DUF1828 domain-containing protein [Pseudomonas aeruginosa]|nr:DUF1828 domain-containing protein [Pseudomonas aeruginosa]RMJ34084.1 hypothetical protein BFC97_26355 [Pseudomonas aeruginosa 39016]AZM86955.1 DUF1828 domain-containing protein [Pseudomonas aeruginosa]EIU3573459.1 DUF1828 domain-containing protein [Pseudomonas aeruginosa]EIU3804001.1 DUF1828 domain-containing protein [Pseudomonas aeruginosa]
MDASALQKQLCSTFCQDVKVSLGDGFARVNLPMTGRDGDGFTAYLQPIPAGWRISDMGTTMMRLSYENDLSKLFTGSRGKLFATILKESGISEDDGDLYLEVPADAISRGLFTLGQGITRVEDLGLWTHSRIESTFYEDLATILESILPPEQLERGYVVPGVPNGDSYPVDYFIRTKGRPLYLFGVNNKEKAMLTTIILQHLIAAQQDFDSMVICANIEEIPKLDRRRLTNAANDVVATIQDTDVIRNKIEHRVRA